MLFFVTQCLSLVISYSVQHSLSILLVSVLLRLRLTLGLLSVLVLRLTLSLLVLLLLLVLLVLFLLVLLLILSPTLLLLLLLLLQESAGVSQIVTGIVVLGIKFESFLVAIDCLLQSFHLLRLHSRLEQAVSLIMQGAGTLLVGEVWRSKSLLVAAGCLFVSFLPVEVSGEIVLSPVVGTVSLQCLAIIHLSLLVALLVIVAISLTNTMTAGLRRSGETYRKEC